MKKIILGLLQTTLSPFIIILGYNIISQFRVNEGALIFASVMGGLSICFNFVIGTLLIIKGYQELKAFDGWKA